MSKRDCNWDYKKIQRYITEGRGMGTLGGYKSWLNIQDYPSKGRVSRILGWKTGRIHHLFSDIQARYFYILDWNDEVVDIREHFPLLDLSDVLTQNKDLKQDYFVKDEVPYILTTTFFITLKNNIHIARSLKLPSELNKKSVLDRLEIERRYWDKKGIDWGIVTLKEIDAVMAKNIEWVHSALFSFNERGLTDEMLNTYSGIIIQKLKDSNCPIRKVICKFDNEYNTEFGTGLYIFKYLVAMKNIQLDMSKPIELNKSATEIILNIRIGDDAFACNQ